MRTLWSAVALVLLVTSVSCDSPTAVGRVQVTIGGPPSIRMTSLGERATLAVMVHGADVTDVVWRSSNVAVASVDRAGVVTAVGDGVASVIAAVGATADSVVVTIEQEAVGLRFLTEPEHSVRGVTFIPAVRVGLVDGLGSAVAAGSTPVTVSLVGGTAGALMGTAVQVAVSGIATFDDLAVATSGSSFRLEASVARAGGPVLATTSVAFDVVDEADVIVLRNGLSGLHGLLIDGRGASGDVNDRGVISADTIVNIVMSAAAETNEVLAFTEGRPPILVPAPWTSGADTVSVEFPSPVAIPLTIWIVRGPFATQRQRAADAVVTTAAIFQAERMGVVFSNVEFIDATATADTSSLFDQTLCNQQTRTTTSIGNHAGRINVYYVATVDGGAGRGRACGTSYIIMAERSGHELLAHEIGHTLGLGHVDGDVRYDQTNVMHSASNSRQYLTEGQVFRTHYNAFSALRALYAARTDTPRTCPDGVGTAGCPHLHHRLWADGAFPADPAPWLTTDAAARWLAADCDVGGAAVTAVELLESGVRTEAELLAVLEATLPSGVEAAAREAARRHTHQRGVVQSTAMGLDPAVAEVFLSIDETRYAERARADAVVSLHTRAIDGLGSVGGELAAARLAVLAADSESGYAAPARTALARIVARR